MSRGCRSRLPRHEPRTAARPAPRRHGAGRCRTRARRAAGAALAGVLGRAHAGHDDQRARRRRLGDRLPQRRLLRARARAARRRGPAARVRDPHDALAPARPPPPARARRRSPSTARSSARASTTAARRAARSIASSCWRARARLLGPWFADAVRTTTSGARTASRSRRSDERDAYKPGAAPAPREARRADAARAPAARAGLAHVRAGARSRPPRRSSRRSSQPQTLAGLRHRPRALHRRAPRRARRADVRDRGLHRAAAARAGDHLRGYVTVDAAAAARRRRRRARRTTSPSLNETDGPLRPRRAAGRARRRDPLAALARRPTRATSWAAASTGCCSTSTTARRYLRAAGTWDDMPLTLERPIAARAQGPAAFWGGERPESSMLIQIADAPRGHERALRRGRHRLGAQRPRRGDHARARRALGARRRGGAARSAARSRPRS